MNLHEAPRLCEVVITAPDPDWLYVFGLELVRSRMASNVHNFAAVRSVYRWDEQVCERVEGRASIHTRQTLIPEIVARAKEAHPYVVPSVSARLIVDGNPEYLEWILSVTREGVG